jgi:DNA-binding FadR family transcriptional regulator
MSIMLAHDAAETACPRRTRAEELRMRRTTLCVGNSRRSRRNRAGKSLSVSRTPVREAIRMLTSSELVEVRAHRATVEARPTQEHLFGR